MGSLAAFKMGSDLYNQSIEQSRQEKADAWSVEKQGRERQDWGRQDDLNTTLSDMAKNASAPRASFNPRAAIGLADSIAPEKETRAASSATGAPENMQVLAPGLSSGTPAMFQPAPNPGLSSGTPVPNGMLQPGQQAAQEQPRAPSPQTAKPQGLADQIMPTSYADSQRLIIKQQLQVAKSVGGERGATMALDAQQQLRTLGIKEDSAKIEDTVLNLRDSEYQQLIKTIAADKGNRYEPVIDPETGLATLKVGDLKVAFEKPQFAKYMAAMHRIKFGDPSGLDDIEALHQGLASRVAAEVAILKEGIKDRNVMTMEDRKSKNRIDEKRAELAVPKPPAGYRPTAAGNLEAIPGGPAFEDKPLNDGQSKALLFGSRMREADKVLGTLAGEGTGASYGQNLPVIGGAITALSSDNQQMLKQAKTDFMTAVLRRESGASISTGEFTTADKQYFPQAGDSDKVKAQKAANRELAINGVLMEVPEKHRNSLSSPKVKPEGSWESGADIPRMTSSAEALKLKPGTVFVDANGVTRRRP